MDFKTAIDRIRNAIYGVEVRESIAVMGEYLEEYFHECASKIGDAIQSAKDAAASASEAKQALSDTKDAKTDALEAINTAESDALTNVANATTDAETAARNASASAASAAKSETNAGTKASEAAGSASAAEASAKAAEASANKAAAAVGTDKTLSIADVPADSKTVGDALDGKLETTSAGYVKSVSVSGNTMTITKGDGTSQSEQLAESYILPAATADTLGGVKVGAELDIAADGTISAESLKEELTETIAASVAVKSETRYVWESYYEFAKKWTTVTVTGIPDNVDYLQVQVQFGTYPIDTENDRFTIPRGSSTSVEMYPSSSWSTFKTSFQEGTFTLTAPYSSYTWSINIWLTGYHYPTLAELLAETQAAQEDTDALLVDQEYRLTLLELGVE